ncbi:putative pectin lyase C [Phytophthora citrophthora]|uniref:Pectin lyase C n=1 Tax=Phytophthora citrophthora TaxID=4793 RepID=A0AAD9GMZ5_9STRA|nr:putative pectin lyase C [Phytophthora citrophthora]
MLDFRFVLAFVGAALLLDRLVAAGTVVVGTPTGFAAGTTGGGDVEPVYPTTVKELVTYLSDSEPRVIVLKKEFNFIKSEGSTMEKGCRGKNNANCIAKKYGFKGQDEMLLDTSVRTCDGTHIDITYDNAATKDWKLPVIKIW